MAITDVSFSAAVDDWVKQSEARLQACFRESAQEVVNLMTTPVGQGGNLPKRTGFLGASVRATTNAPTPMRPDAVPEKGKTYRPDGSVLLVIAGLELGQTLYACFTAAYARRQEYGFKGTDSLGREYNQAGRGFVRLAAQQWQAIVTRVANRLRDQAGS